MTGIYRFSCGTANATTILMSCQLSVRVDDSLRTRSQVITLDSNASNCVFKSWGPHRPPLAPFNFFYTAA